jgi:hypothetical protein
MSFLVNLCFAMVVLFALTSSLTLPFINLHVANSDLALIKTNVNDVIDQNRNTLDNIENQITDVLSNYNSFELVSINTSEANDFKVIELEFKYKNLFQDMNKNIEKQKLRFIVNNV